MQVGLATEAACLTSNQVQGVTMELQLHSCPFLMAMPGTTAFPSLMPRELASLPLLARLEALTSAIRSFFHASPAESAPFQVWHLLQTHRNRKPLPLRNDRHPITSVAQQCSAVP